MTSNSPHPKGTMQDYAHQVPSQQPLEWHEDGFYPHTSASPSAHPTYYAHPAQLLMEPAHPLSPYQSASGPAAPFPVHHAMQYHPDAHSSQQANHGYQYAPASSSVSRTPVYSSPPTPPSQTSSAHSTRWSPSLPASTHVLSQGLPEDVRNAINAAFESREYARGENVPADILMPTIQKIDKELWECRICTKPHKRRDHTLTHVRTAHLDNKGFRCTAPGCDSAFGRKGDLERHVSSTHQEIDPPDAICPKCHSQLHRKDNLIRHLKSCRVSSGSARYGASTSRSSRRSDYAMAHPSAPYPTSFTTPASIRRCRKALVAPLKLTYWHLRWITLSLSFLLLGLKLIPNPSSPQFPPLSNSTFFQHSSRSPRPHYSSPDQTPTLQAPLPVTFIQSPSDDFYDPTGYGFIDAVSVTMPQPWSPVAAPCDYPSFDLGNSTMILTSWV